MLLNEAKTLSRQHYWIVILCCAGWVFDFYDLILFSFLQLPIAQELGFTKDQVSLVYSCTLLMTGAGGITFGLLSDRWGRKRVLQWTIITYCAGTLLCAFTKDLWWLLVFRSITGLGVGGEWGAGHTLISETFPPQRRGWFGALMQSGAAIGFGLATIMGAFFAPRYGWRLTFGISALPAALVILVRRFLPESDVWLRHREQNDLPSFGSLASELFRAPLLRVTLFSLVLAALNMSAYWFTYTWLLGYLKGEKHLTITQSGWWTLTIVAGQFIGYTTFGLVSDRIGRKPAFSLFAVLMACGISSIAFGWDYFYARPALLLCSMVIMGIGTGTWSNFGPMFSELYPTRVRSTALNSIYNLARAIQFVTPILIARLAVDYGFGAGIALGAVFSILAGIWIWMLPETKGRIISAAV